MHVGARDDQDIEDDEFRRYTSTMARSCLPQKKNPFAKWLIGPLPNVESRDKT